MDADELRNLADALEPMAPAPRFSGIDAPAACAYLRACADAMDAGPVAWTWANGEVLTDDQTDPMWKGGGAVALYPLAMPAQAQPLRLPEPMTDGQMLDVLIDASKAMAAANGVDMESASLNHDAIKDGLLAGRAIETVVLRRLKEANNAVVMLGALRLPEPMTDEEVDALIDETESLPTDHAVRYLVETGERRVKEVNE